MGKTAAELMAELEKDEKYQAKKLVRDAHFSKLQEMYKQNQKQLIRELNSAGFKVNSVWDFVNSKNNYMEAESILVRHLKQKYHPRILSGIARSLAVPEFSDNNELWERLTELYSETPSDKETDIPEERGTQEAIAVAIEVLATDDRKEDLKKLIEQNPNGDCIDWLKDKLLIISG